MPRRPPAIEGGGRFWRDARRFDQREAVHYTGRMNARWAYQNGDWISYENLRIAVDDVGFTLGATVTERLRTFHGRVFRLEEHLARMHHSLAVIGLDADRIVDELRVAIPSFVDRNASDLDSDNDWSIAVFATPGVPSAGAPTVCVHGNSLPFRQWAQAYDEGIDVVISDVRQVPENCWPPSLKCRSRMHYYLADLQATARQPGSRAVLLDQDGFIGEATTANVLIFRAGEGLVSPPVDHILAGVSLGVILELAATIGENFVFRPISPEDFRAADEAFIASTSICIQPIISCDGLAMGSGAPGKVYRRLVEAWSDLVGMDFVEQARRRAKLAT
jgi:branched-subunit amino acid aminotransferase/4-amino-4-deoxychorismate lyase